MNSPQTEPAASASLPTDSKKRKGRRIYYFALAFSCLCALFLILFFFWFFYSRFYESTDDAYVGGCDVTISCMTSSNICAIWVDETDMVQEGQLLIELDPTEVYLLLEKSKNNLALVIRQVMGMYDLLLTDSAKVRAAEADMAVKNLEMEHRDVLIQSGAVSLEETEKARAEYLASKAMLEVAKVDYWTSYSQVAQTKLLSHPQVLKAIDALRMAYVNYTRCRILAPCSGMIAKRRAQVGMKATPGDPLLAIVPLNAFWVEANFKETELKKLRVGQPARIRADIWGDSVAYTGKVLGIGAGTGSVFSAIPPQNATGNWIKIVQRVPVRISLREKEIKKHPLRLGLSLQVTVDLHDTSGKFLSPVAEPQTPIYQTGIYKDQTSGAEEIISSIVKANALPRYLDDHFYKKLFSIGNCDSPFAKTCSFANRDMP